MALCAALTGCVPSDAPPKSAPDITYEGVETTLLEDDLVAIQARLRGAAGPQAVDDYARCAAARYALIRGFGFARHVRTGIDENDGQWTAQGVYTVSAAFPPGVTRIDAEVLVESCAERGIPTV